MLDRCERDFDQWNKDKGSLLNGGGGGRSIPAYRESARHRDSNIKRPGGIRERANMPKTLRVACKLRPLLVLDNAGVHCSRTLQDLLAEYPRVVLYKKARPSDRAFL